MLFHSGLQVLILSPLNSLLNGAFRQFEIHELIYLVLSDLV
jgi:hypothetical protein